MKTVAAIVALGLAVVISGAAQARLPETSGVLRDMRLVQAVHAPTGCVARVYLIDGAVSRATIVDPSCLPRGVAEREVPGTKRDFEFIKK